jgi:hypothetical protein
MTTHTPTRTFMGCVAQILVNLTEGYTISPATTLHKDLAATFDEKLAADAGLLAALTALEKEADRVGNYLSKKGQGATALGMACLAARKAIANPRYVDTFMARTNELNAKCKEDSQP